MEPEERGVCLACVEVAKQGRGDEAHDARARNAHSVWRERWLGGRYLPLLQKDQVSLWSQVVQYTRCSTCDSFNPASTWKRK